MSGAREAILSRIADARDGVVQDESEIAAEAGRLIDAPEKVRPALPEPDAAASFAARIAGPKVGASVERIGDFADLPKTVADFISKEGLPSQIALQPVDEIRALDWTGAGLAVINDVNDGIGVGIARWGIAETGSLVVHSSSDAPILFNLLPLVHIAVVRAENIVGHLEDYIAAARAVGDPAPRNVCLITGASGTSDIEGAFVAGAHGPRTLHIVIVG